MEYKLPRIKRITGATTAVAALTVAVSATNLPETAASPVRGTKAAVSTTGPSGVPGQWRQVFNDEFTAKSTDRSKWNTGWFGDGITQGVNPEEVACYSPGNLAYGGGSVRMMFTRRAQVCGGRSKPYTGAMLTTMNKFEFTYGYVETRMWVAGLNGKIVNWPGFWLNGHTWPNDGEIDILEGLGGNAAYNLHWGSSPAAAAQMGSAVKGNFTGWHTFGVDWQPNSITFYYDGRKATPINTSAYGRNPAPGNVIPAAKHYLIMGNSSAGPKPVATASLFVDYVRIWQR